MTKWIGTLSNQFEQKYCSECEELHDMEYDRISDNFRCIRCSSYMRRG